MKNESIKCDNCGLELITNTPYPHNYCLELKVIDTNRNTSNIQYAVYMAPPFEGTKEFCSHNCLNNWANKDKLQEPEVIFDTVFSVKSYNSEDKQVTKRMYESNKSYKNNYRKMLNDQRVDYIKVFQLNSIGEWVHTKLYEKEK